jgi:uncharacterized protein
MKVPATQKAMLRGQPDQTRRASSDMAKNRGTKSPLEGVCKQSINQIKVAFQATAAHSSSVATYLGWPVCMTGEARPLLSGRGEVTLEVRPEIVELTITCGARDPKRERALELLSKRNEQCLALLKSYGNAVAKIETSGVAVHRELGFFGRKEKVRACWGRTRVKVTITGFAVLGDLIARMSDQDVTALEGPWWKLRHDNSPVHRQVRQEAARDAVVRAREYAEAVGARLLSLVELADEGLTTEAPAPRAHAAPAGAALRTRSSVPEPAPIDIEPQAQVVRARVEARFTISTPEAI